MAPNPNMTFNLSRGNPDNNPCGIGLNSVVYGQTLGGQYFDEENLGNLKILKYNIPSGSTNVFDNIVASDVIKSNINYRCIYITNKSINQYVILNEVSVSDVVPDPITGIETPGSTGSPFSISNVDMNVEGVYTINEVKRKIPSDFGKPGNPSIYINDEYDTDNKLRNLVFKKTWSGNELPLEIPPQCVLKIWVRRVLTVDKENLPEEELTESFTLTVKEPNLETSLEVLYQKEQGRLPLSNWYEYTITPSNGTPVIMRELIPKEVDVSLFNIVKTFYINKKVLIFYYMEVLNQKKYFLLIVDPNDIPEQNKYVQVELLFTNDIEDGQELTDKELKFLENSFYDENIFYFFWNEEITIVDPCALQYFGFFEKFDRISTDSFYSHIWTSDDIFDNIVPGYENRRIDSYEPIDYKIIRDRKNIINIEHFDDLFILFTKDTMNLALSTLQDVNVNQNELLYIFEKDIEDSRKYTKFNNFPGINSQVFSQRLYPVSLPKISQITSFNNVPKVNTKLIISDSTSLPREIDSTRRIKTLLDGSRYVDLNSVHGREFKIGNRFLTYELPIDETLNRINITTSFSVNNDELIYDNLNPTFLTSYQLPNKIDNEIYERPLFQQNIIDESKLNSLSIPTEWADREYKDEWKTILSTVPITQINNSTTTYTLQYNFACNVWRSIYLDKNGDPLIEYHDTLTNDSTNSISTTGTTGTTGSSGSPICKKYTEINRKDLDWVIEPDTYQPLTFEISANVIPSTKVEINYFINIKVFFKGNIKPLANINTYSTNLSNLSYVIFNPDRTFSYRMNYFDIMKNDGQTSDEYRLVNLHSSLLNKFNINIGPEFTVNPQLSPLQSEFPFYRRIDIDGFIELEDGRFNDNTDFAIPITIYGNGYNNSNDSESNNIPLLSKFLGSENTFDFSQTAINDRSIRLYSDASSRKPLKFKVAYYDYERDYAVIWVRLQDAIRSNFKLFLYYGKSDKSENRQKVTTTYSFIKTNLFSTSAIGSWFFDSIIEDERISFTDGRIYNSGEPVIFEKTDNGDLRLTQIDKEYMYGIAQIFRSHKFNLNFDVENLSEPDLYFDDDKKEEFETFIRDSVDVFKPSYTELNQIKPFGIDVLEAGGGSMGLSNNRRVSGLIAMSPNSNVNTFYERTDNTRFNMLTSFNGFSQNIDWVIAKEIDTSLFKAGVLKVNGNIKSETIKFDSPFKDKNYFIFISNPLNQKIYWNNLCPDRFTVSASYFLEKEVAWMAFHQDVFGGVFTPDSIYVGRRTLTDRVFIDSDGNSYNEWPGNTNDSLIFPSPTEVNLEYWYNNELIIKPEIGVESESGNMNINVDDPGYSIILSSNENINMYWVEKSNNQFRVRTSSPVPCTVHYLAIKNGIEWWDELI